MSTHVNYSQQNPRKTTLKCLILPTNRPVRLPGRRPAKGKFKRSRASGARASGIVMPAPDDLLDRIYSVVKQLKQRVPTSEQKNVLVLQSRWKCLNSSLLSLKIPLENYQPYAIKKGILQKIEQETNRGKYKNGKESEHRASRNGNICS